MARVRRNILSFATLAVVLMSLLPTIALAHSGCIRNFSPSDNPQWTIIGDQHDNNQDGTNSGGCDGELGVGSKFDLKQGRDNSTGGGIKDKMYGGADNDNLSGAGGNDDLYGEGGNDNLVGGLGGDYLNGGAGSDDCNPGGDSGDQRVNCE